MSTDKKLLDQCPSICAVENLKRGGDQHRHNHHNDYKRKMMEQVIPQS
jgi:hypothetical protein